MSLFLTLPKAYGFDDGLIYYMCTTNQIIFIFSWFIKMNEWILWMTEQTSEYVFSTNKALFHFYFIIAQLVVYKTTKYNLKLIKAVTIVCIMI